MKKLLNRLALGAGTIGVIIAGAAAFSAFEAHVVNVTATIENATNISTSALTFGTVFPQEILHSPVTLSLSSSFLAEGNTNATFVDYVIKQKPKCGLPVPSASTSTPVAYSAFGLVTENEQGVFSCVDDGYVMLPLLCPYLSKTSPTPGDTSVPSFHGPTSTPAWTDAISVATQAVGHLAKNGVTSTTWDIDLHTPCFKGQCAQDWASYVHTANPDANPASYMADPALQHQQFGCDLWYEVTGIDQGEVVERPTIGAALASYVAPTGGACNVTVDDNGGNPALDTITEGIAIATPGQTVCVLAGTYAEDVDVNKDITLAGAGAGSTNIIGQTSGEAGAVIITANGATVQGFDITDATGGVAAVRISGAHSGITVSSNQINGVTGGNAFLTDGGQSNHTISNNVINGGDAGQPIAYVNGLASVNVASDNVDFLNNTFGGVGTEALGQEASNSQVQQNRFSSVTSFTDVEDWEGGNLYNQNNFNDIGLNLQHSENGNTGDNGITNAENNWWGDTDPSDGDVNANVDVDFVPSEASAFPQN